MIDDLGVRMKEHYELRYRFFLPRRTYTIIRVDGKAFHSYTRGCERPFDTGLTEQMDRTAMHLCQNIRGAVFTYTQSDEISVLLTDFETEHTDAWFDGNLQKIVSISASLATATFNSLTPVIETRGGLAYFDSRAFTIPDPTEVYNYFVWRQQDCSRNSLQMAAQAWYSQRELQNRSGKELQELLFRKGINWNDYPVRIKRGCLIERKSLLADVEYVHKKTGMRCRAEACERRVWGAAEEMPVFTREPEWLIQRIPRYPLTDQREEGAVKAHTPLPQVRLLAISDLHGDLAAARLAVDLFRPDALVSCGDWGDPEEVDEAELAALIARLPVLTTFGNHDPRELLGRLRNADGSAVLLGQGEVRSIQGVRVAAIGGIWAKSHRHPYYVTDEDVAEAADRIAAGGRVDLLLTHGCPVGLADRTIRGSHGGQRCFLEALQKIQPCVHLCGHLHVAQEHVLKDGRKVINVGATPRGTAVVVETRQGEISAALERFRRGTRNGAPEATTD